MGNRLLSRFGALHGVAYRRGKNSANVAAFAKRQQIRQIILMQTRSCRIMNQHPFRIPRRAQASQHRFGAFCTTFNNGDLRMICERKLLETFVTVTDGDDDAFNPRMRQQRSDRVFKNRFVTD
jgi:hypothetical protein